MGSYCEFERVISDKTMDEVMQMPGSGTFDNLQPGQVTDDSELALHMAYGIVEAYRHGEPLGSQKDALIQSIAKQYVKWATEGRPFDIGQTCAGAIRKLSKLVEHESPEKFVKLAFDQVRYVNEDSESNGSLMRITPMAVFASYMDGRAPPEVIEPLIKCTLPLTQPR